jgi:hypothetical protein
VSCSDAGGVDDDALGVLVGEAMGSEEDGDLGVRKLVDLNAGSDEVRPQPAGWLRKVQVAPLDGVVFADNLLLLSAEDLPPQPSAASHEARALLLRRGGERGVVLADIGLGELAVGGLGGGDAGQGQILW